MVIDSHAHILSKSIVTDRVINSMQTDGLEKIITVGTDAETSFSYAKLAGNNKDIYAIVGLYPEYADQITEKDLKIIDELADSEKVIAIGEIGLDFHVLDNKEKQIDLFKKQLDIAVKHDLPVCIHTRSAAEETYNILKEYAPLLKRKGVMHCFSENKEYALKFLELGFYISFSGNITYKNADRSFLKDIPLDKILVETDSPHLAPEPLRGHVNVPANVKITAQKIADELCMDFEEFCKRTVENTYRVYYKMKRG
ncbi:MAG: TatD family hydrolase [Clostridia bacterium]|nr:TatD family hydrolase [Clostridia bacterium]